MEKRLQRVAKAMGADEPERGRIAYADLPSWPPDAREAFLAADVAGDTATMDDLVLARTGVRPTRTGRFVGLIVDMPIPALDPDAAVRAAADIVKETQR